MAGCGGGCPWWDPKHSWPEAMHPPRPLSALAAEAVAAAEAGAAFVVISGGEPLHHQLDGLCRALGVAGLPPHPQTSGVGPPSCRLAWTTLPPHPHPPPHPAPVGRDPAYQGWGSASGGLAGAVAQKAS